MVRLPILLVVVALLGSGGDARDAKPTYHLISGSVPADKGPDGNSVFLNAPDGLVLVDTGRHPELPAVRASGVHGGNDAGWKRDAQPFIDAEHTTYVEEAAAYYIGTRLRSSPEEQQKYCRPLRS